jgi:polyhydroxybutyrate depolymerase
MIIMTIKRMLSLVVFTAFLSVSYAQSFSNKSLQYEGLTREYSIYIPASYDGTSGFPLLFNFHGGDDVIANWQTSSDMTSLADTGNFILVYPQARQTQVTENL